MTTTNRPPITRGKAFEPQWVIHPGEYWRDVMAEAECTQAAVAKAMDMDPEHLGRIVQGHVLPTAMETIRFGEATGGNARALWDLCAEYELGVAMGKVDLTDQHQDGDPDQ